MKQCWNCKSTKNLKSIFIEDCDCHFDSIEKPEYPWTCKNCFFESCACGYETHSADECLTYESCENHENTKQYLSNWNDFDSHWKRRSKK